MIARTLPFPKSILLLAVAGLAGNACAQTGTGYFAWQASVDEGQSWTGTSIDVSRSQQSVLVRTFVGWSSSAGYAFGSVGFDVAITTPGSSDDALDFDYPYPFNRYNSGSRLRSARFGNVIKIDRNTDTSPPGQGTGWVTPLQPYENFSDDFTSANPVEIFRFRLNLDGSIGERSVSEFFGSHGGDSNTTDRFMRVWTTRDGHGNFPLSARAGLVINVVPSPGFIIAFLPFAGALQRRRRPIRSL